MTQNERLVTLQKARLNAETDRDDLAQSLGHEHRTRDSGDARARFIEVQALIEAIDRAMADVERQDAE